MKNHLGIMGGTFNPVHIGHLIVAQEVLNRFGFERIYFVPNQIPPHRKGTEDLASGEDRYIMVNLAVASNPSFMASRIEIDREGVSYTLDTVKIIKSMHPDLDVSFITGVDSILKDRWKGFDELLDLLEYFICVTRPGFDENLLLGRMKEYGVKKPERVILQKIPGFDISSTVIRERVRTGLPIRYMVPDSVESYIGKKHLYREAL